MASTLSQNRSKGMGMLHLMVMVFCLTYTHVDCETNCDSQTVQSQTPYARVDRLSTLIHLPVMLHQSMLDGVEVTVRRRLNSFIRV
ncbi:hypothetical protein HOLleu_08972 [Holothuria leucospilota]|uniref:Secreted protein n=1 Tax=Holothuria leucospilota TaxID=206669 RepID=A0A9Q1HDU4_HOLLE|nr:hypothetical protein HOLleu_08972 [Holothuria leucospilota]